MESHCILSIHGIEAYDNAYMIGESTRKYLWNHEYVNETHECINMVQGRAPDVYTYAIHLNSNTELV